MTSFTLFFFLILVLFFENPFNRYFITMDGQVVSSLLPPYMSLQADRRTARVEPAAAPLWHGRAPAGALPRLYRFHHPVRLRHRSAHHRRTDDQWIKSTRKWSLMAWLFLSIGLVLGSRWAYDVLDWGGYWGWDPVEISALIPG